MSEVLSAKQLSIEFQDGSFKVHPVDIHLNRGEILSIIGESGSGKSTLVKALTHLNAANAVVHGSVQLCGKDLYIISEKERTQMRMHQFAIAMQNSRELLNPMLTVRSQLNEVLVKKYSGQEKELRLKKLIELTTFPAEALDNFPSELSGGMVQKVLLMSAISLHPDVVLLDEPTSALDHDSAMAVTRMIQKIHQEEGTSFLIITHDLQFALDISSRVMVFYEGSLVEEGPTQKVFYAPHHPYTRGLFQSSMDINPYRDIWGIRKTRKDAPVPPQGCPFYGRCHQCIDICRTNRPAAQKWGEDETWKVACNRGGIVKILEGTNVSKSFAKHKVLEGLDLHIYSAEVVALVGPSGSGKSTLAHILSGVITPDTGTILYDGAEADFSKLHRIFGGMQIVRQDPDTALNPNMTVLDAITEPLIINVPKMNMEAQALDLLDDVGLENGKELLHSPVRRLSGGQKQKVMLARALSMKPKLLIADEVTSMLDASGKANLLRLLKSIQNSHGLSMLFITHDYNSALKISDRIYRMDSFGVIREVAMQTAQQIHL